MSTYSDLLSSLQVVKEVERVVTQEKEVPIEKVVIQDKVVEVQTVVATEVPVYVDKVVVTEIAKEVPIEKVLYEEKIFEVEKPVVIEKIVEVKVDRVVTTEVPVYVEKVPTVSGDQQLPVQDDDAIQFRADRATAQRSAAPARTPITQRSSSPQSKAPASSRTQEYAPVAASTHVRAERIVEVGERKGQSIEIRSSFESSGPHGSSLAESTRRAVGYREANHVGLGLRLERSTRSPDVYVQEIIPGFAAHDNGRLQTHDVIVAVDHIPLTEMDLEAVKQLTIGEEGTFCTLQVQRGDHYFQVTLMRKFPDRISHQNSSAVSTVSDNSLRDGHASTSSIGVTGSPRGPGSGQVNL